MSTGLGLRLLSDGWDSKGEAAAVVEISPAPGGANNGTRISKPLSVGGLIKEVDLAAGDYLVRLYLPSGDVETEHVRLTPGEMRDVTFHLRASPREWLSSAMNVGVVQTLPRRKEAGELKAMLGEATSVPVVFDTLVQRATVSVERATDDLLRITGNDKVEQAKAWRWVHRIDPLRPWPKSERMEPLDLVRWWTGQHESEPSALTVAVHDSHNAIFVQRTSPPIAMTWRERPFVAIRDPVGCHFYAVLPERWLRQAFDEPRWAEASILLTVVVESAMSPHDDFITPVRWRCSPQVDDVEAMSLLGFLYSGRSRAGRTLLRRAHRWLFGKRVNPVAAAAGAYMLLSFADEASETFDPSWRHWIRNLYEWFPAVPDGAIAMAQMAMLYGETSVNDKPNLERIRKYALEAVQRGVPYLSFGIRILTEVLVVLVGDDRTNKRTGKAVEQTKLALQLVRRLGRIAQPGEFFTVLRLDEELP